jgi:hypothetical protein
MRALAAGIIVGAVSSLGLCWPEVSEEERAANARAREALEAEAD